MIISYFSLKMLRVFYIQSQLFSIGYHITIISNFLQALVEAMEGAAMALGPVIGAGIYEVHSLSLNQ